MCILHILLTHLFISAYLGCFYSLLIVNNAAMGMGVQIAVWIPGFILLSMYTKVELLDYVVIFGGTAILFFIVAMCILHSHHQYTMVPVLLHPCQCLLFSPLLSLFLSLCVCLFLRNSYPNGYAVVVHSGFAFKFP